MQRDDGQSSSRAKGDPRGASPGKVTICHATGSSKNPYVEITISANALKAHRAHQDGEDLIDVPASGCPDGTATAGAATGRHGRVTICHATGSATNPFVEITVAASALAAHTRHQHGEDIVGAPERCVAPTAGTAILQPPAAASSDAASPATAAVPAASGVEGVTAESGTGPAGEVPATPRRQSLGGGSLPFTGLAVIVLALLGAALLTAGVGVRTSASDHD